jgi:hypothetical protein
MLFRLETGLLGTLARRLPEGFVKAAVDAEQLRSGVTGQWRRALSPGR